MVDPPKVIEEKYRTNVFVLTSGKTVSGVVVEENAKELKLQSNPLEAKADAAIVIKRDEIDERVVSKISLMPLGLLNTMTKEEILDLLAFIAAGGAPASGHGH